MKVVRCTNCRGAARVAPEVIGLLVVCPRCHSPFLAVEEATAVVAPSPPPPIVAPPRPRFRPDPPGEFPRPAGPRRRSVEPVAPPPAPHGGDPHAPPHTDPGKLPVSVLIGLALLPFVIPLAWVIAPLVLGHPPTLSLATPVALAVSASALCLAVVYTIDWTPITRVKGVVVLVGLSYMAGLSLYFLKKDMVDGVRRVVGEDRNWHEFRVPNGDCKVKMPGKPTPAADLRPIDGWNLKCYRASHKGGLAPPVVFVIGVGDDPNPARAGDEKEWFDAVKRSVIQGGAVDEKVIRHEAQNLPGRQWEFRRGRMIQVVQVFRAKGRLYYLSAEGQTLDPDGNLARDFFESFHVTGGQD